MRNDIQTFAARALDEEIDQVEKCDVSVMFVGLNPVINDRLQKRRAEILQRSKSARLHSDTSVCIFSSQHSNPSRSHKPTWGNLRCECQSETEGSVKAGNMLTDLHGTLSQPDHFKKHDIFHAVFLVVTVHASRPFPRSFPLLSRALLSFLRLKQSDNTGQHWRTGSNSPQVKNGYIQWL